jgi:hypothetical protein
MTSISLPAADAEFLMTLELGIDADGILTAERVIQSLLDLEVPMVAHEHGGVYFAHEPDTLPEQGLAGARVHGADPLDPDESQSGHGTGPYSAEIELVGRDVLALGRLVAEIPNRVGPAVTADGYIVAPRRPGAGGDLWRAHAVRLPRGGHGDGWNCPPGYATTIGGEPASLLSCYLAFALAGTAVDAMVDPVKRLLGVELSPGHDPGLGERYAEYTRPTGGSGSVTSVMVRPGANAWSEFLPGRGHEVLLEVTRDTPSLLDLGLLAVAVERHLGAGVTTLSYRAFGDLVRDRVPRAVLYTAE